MSPSTTRSGGYVSRAHVDALREHLSERDWAVIRDVAALRLASGAQLERLHFAELGDVSRSVVRRRCLGRLVSAKVLATLERRIGGVRAGSTGLIYGLGIAGKRLMATDGRPTRPGEPGARFVRHVLAVAELYVELVEAARAGHGQVERFEAEPACWWPDGSSGWLKPDAHLTVSNDDHADHWWVEVDLATEHLPTIERKLLVYADFPARGQLGPDGVMPWVLITVPDGKRCSEIVRLIHQLPVESRDLFTVVLHKDAANTIMGILRQA